MNSIRRRWRNSRRQRAIIHVASRDSILRFIASVREVVDRILEAPVRWRAFDEDVRRCFTHVFPYGILYTVERDYVLIVAVAHCSRKPGYWKHRRSP